jgi:copper chaperone CopZ
VIQTIASYAKQSAEDPVAKMNTIAIETAKVVKEQLPEAAGIKEVKAFFKDQKTNILLYLPADLNMGELLHDNTLDDNTNKMEGPISSLMQSIGAAFSTNATEEEIKNK